MNKRKTKTTRKMRFAEILKIGVEMFHENPVWNTQTFEDELRRRWEKKTGETVNDHEKTKAGRLRWRNLADWVKAELTRRRATLTVTVAKKEYRCRLDQCGQVNGIELTSMSHFSQAIRSLAAAIASDQSRAE